MNKVSLEVKNLNVYYGSLQALHDLNIVLPDNQITAIIGPSGCGKTTFLKTLNRMIETDEDVRITGQVIIDGEDIYKPGTEITHIRKKMGLLSQHPYPLPMSIYDNVAYGPRIHGEKNKAELDKIVEFYLKEANLFDEVKDRLHAPAARLSIGQQQRLCLARGLAVKPEFILGDEPTSALDPQSSIMIESKFIELKSKYSIIIVTHILRQAKRIADYIVYMHSGKIIEHGRAEDILNHPKEELTKQYIEGVIS